jgi:hypothetical protein
MKKAKTKRGKLRRAKVKNRGQRTQVRTLILSEMMEGNEE